MNYKHKITNHVIDERYYRKLPFTRKQEFEECEDEVTYYYEDNNVGVDLLGAAVFFGIADSFDGTTQNLSPIDDSSPDIEFGGGEFGGGGAGGDW